MSTPQTTRRPIAICRGVTALAVATLAWSLLSVAVIRADEPPADDASAVLESFGLSRHQARWLTAEETTLRADLSGLRRLERQYRQARTALNREARRAGQLKSQVVKARSEVDRLNELLDGGGLEGRRYNAAVDEVNRRADFINQHVALLASPLGAVTQPAVAKQAQAVIEYYGELSAIAARSTDTLDSLSVQYAELANNPAVGDALDELGDDSRLGPAGDYRSERRRLERLAEAVWSDELPLAIVDNRPLLPVVLGDRAVGVFALSSEQGFSLISSALAEAVGAKIDTSAPPSRLQAFGAGDYELYPATVERIRLGSHTAENVIFMVLPPEASEVANVLDLSLLRGLDVQLDLPKLTARVRDLPTVDDVEAAESVQAVDKAARSAENR